MVEKLDQEREAFERWVREARPDAPIWRGEDGHYVFASQELAWRAWQARAALDGGKS